MFVTRHLSLAAAAAMVVAALAPPALAQSGAKELMEQDQSKLIEILQNADAPVFEKAKACQRLAVIGNKDAVPALAALLADETLNLYARTGLEGIADPAADEALREAAGKLQGRQLVGVIDSLGQRRDAEAVELLGGLQRDGDSAVVTAAAMALGRIATPEAAEALHEALVGDSARKEAIAHGCLACADVLAASDPAGRVRRAVSLYRAVAQAKLPKHLVMAALLGQFRVEGANARDLLVEQIRSPDEAFFNLGLAVAREMPGAEVTSALSDEVAGLPPERQALLLLALGDREDAPPLPVVLAASRSDYPAVREAALRVLARIGDASAVAILLDAALGEGEVSQTAQERLKTVPGEEVDAAIVSRLAGADAPDTAVLFDLAAARRIAAALPAVQEALSASEEPVRLAAIAALGQLIELDDLELLTSRALAGDTGTETVAAQAALRTAALRIGDREACATQLAANLDQASGENRVFLLELLGKVSGRQALDTLVAAAGRDDPQIKDAATRVLGQWANADAAPALLQIARNDVEPKYRVRALRGYLRIARQLQLPADEKLGMFHTAMEVAQRDEERQLALDVLTRIPSVATLELAVSFLDQPALAEAAAGAAVKIAPKLLASEREAVAAAMQEIVDAGVPGNPGTRARQLLDQARGGSP